MTDRIRDVISNPLTLEYFSERTADGWVVQAVEWAKPAVRLEAPAEEEADPREPARQEVPYGQRVAKDCGHLVEDAHEMAVLLTIYEKVVSGWRPTQIAADLNDRGFRTRRETVWTPGTVFELLPRLIELSPRLQKRPDWPARRLKLEISA
jgi:Recombinase